jgi:SAM-dependent methyltransferase
LIGTKAYFGKLALYWKYTIFDVHGIAPHGRILDFGSGLGQISAAINAECFDPSPFAMTFVKQSGRTTYSSPDAIPKASFDYLVSSHSLEHSLEPHRDLSLFRELLRPGGTLVLVLPIERVPGTPANCYDDNRHFYCWNFQTITNLLIESGYGIKLQRVIYGPLGLAKLGSVPLAHRLGRLKRNYPSLLTIAEVRPDT